MRFRGNVKYPVGVYRRVSGPRRPGQGSAPAGTADAPAGARCVQGSHIRATNAVEQSSWNRAGGWASGRNSATANTLAPVRFAFGGRFFCVRQELSQGMKRTWHKRIPSVRRRALEIIAAHPGCTEALLAGEYSRPISSSNWCVAAWWWPGTSASMVRRASSRRRGYGSPRRANGCWRRGRSPPVYFTAGPPSSAARCCHVQDLLNNIVNLSKHQSANLLLPLGRREQNELRDHGANVDDNAAKFARRARFVHGFWHGGCPFER